jgi:hypothetical protein
MPGGIFAICLVAAFLFSNFLELPRAAQRDPDIDNLRDQQYRDQGTSLARKAQVVIALWDWQSAQAGTCGTGWVVDVCRQGPPPLAGSVLAAPETTGLIHIPVRRAKAPDVPSAIGMSVPSGNAHEKVLREIDAFNQALAKSRQERSGDVSDSMGWVIPEDRRGELDSGATFVLHRHAYDRRL